LVTNNVDSEGKIIQVLHVDDDEDHLMISKRQIEKFDPLINMNFISSPSDVLELLESFDCIVSDYKMPNFDGVQLAFTIRETSDIPIILYTGHGSEEVASAAFEAGVDGYIWKESSASHYQVLSKRIRMVVEKYELVRNLRASEAKFRAIAERSFDVIYTSDMNGNVTYISPAVERLGGYKPMDVIGNSFKKYVTGFEGARRSFSKIIKSISKEGLELEFICETGEHKPIEINISPIVDGDRVVGTQGIIRDISFRRNRR
jgi:PAS domain S-box-containing protein